MRLNKAEQPHLPVRIGKTLRTTPHITPRVMRAAALFGIDLDEPRPRTLIPETTINIPIGFGSVILITGASGSGKSTILRQIEDACIANGQRLLKPDQLPPPHDLPLVDVVHGPLTESMNHLAAAGLSDAFVLLRNPAHLSVGEQHRLTIARTLAALHNADTPVVITMDEFAAPLDRLTARTIAHRFARTTRKSTHTLILATSHDDLINEIQPNLHIHADLDATLNITKPLPEASRPRN